MRNGSLGLIANWGKCSMFEYELWGGVTLVQGRQYDKVLVQPYNMKVIGKIKESIFKGSNSAIIRRITQLLLNEENGAIEYVSREENKEADRIT
ncbi:hypothetical protein Gogos_009339, partial [Gossypium gossypioides]|nr:hypothetical protein [Gossypium gossypioides]